jgi:autotransporter-associated beta strand protein
VQNAQRTFTVTNSGASLLVSTPIISTGTSGGITKAGAGTMTVSAANTYTGPTNVTGGTLAVTGSLSGTSSVSVSTGGTLLLNSSTTTSNIVGPFVAGGTPTTGSNSTTVTGAGGILQVGSLSSTGTNQSGTTHTFNSLTLTAASTLDFGAGNTNVNMVFSSLALGGNTLTINNWSPQTGGSYYAVGATQDTGALSDGQSRLLFNTDPGFTLGTTISSISFTGFGQGMEVTWNNGAGTQYEIVPVPEPATTALIGSVALCALIGYRERRRFVGICSRRVRK